jgi:hypothetical protein
MTTSREAEPSGFSDEGSTMSRITRSVLFCALALLAFPAVGSAQFYPTIAPPNSLYYNPAYRYQFNLGVQVPTVYGSAFVGMTAPATRAPQLFTPNPYGGQTSSYSYSYGPSWNPGGAAVTSGYLSGGSYSSNAFVNAQREFEKAQREATYSATYRKSPEAVRDAIYDQWAYEKLGVLGLPSLKGGQEHPEELVRALAATDEREVASGVALNHVLVAIVAAEAKGGKGPSAFIPPQVLDDVRFSGPPAAEALNFLRQAGALPFPAAFADARLKPTRAALERDLAAVAGPLSKGKPVLQADLQKLDFTVKQAQEAVTPVLRNLPFEDATAARRFLNHFQTAVGAMKAADAPNLVNPAWPTDGASVAELVKQMTRHKLLFGAAAPGGEASYLAIHKGLAMYLFAITQKK